MVMLGTQELLIILAIVVVLFGAKRIPQLGAGLGKGVKNFKKGLHGDEDSTSEDVVEKQEPDRDK